MKRRQLRTVALVLPLVAGAFVLPAAAGATGTPAGQPPLTATEAKALSGNVSDKVIVVFKNQLPAISDSPRDEANRVAAVGHVQAGVVDELTRTGARQVKRFQLINAVGATVSPGEARRLSANPSVAEVVPDEPIPVTSSVPSPARTPHSGIAPLAGACPPSGKVQVDPAAVEDIHAAQSGTGESAQALGYSGAGVKVGFIADGIDVDNPDFIRSNGQHVFTDYQDFSGSGTGSPQYGGEAFLDASSIAAQGRETYNIANYAVGLDRSCDIRILGVAPGASLVGLNVFGTAAVVFNSVFLEAINYAVNVDHVNVLNESFGSNPFPDTASLDLTHMANAAAVAAGVTVTVATGDAGLANTIASPATDPAVISVGASTTYRAYAQAGLAGITIPGVTGWLNNNISGLSSGGFDQAGRTVDIVAPGDLNWALCTADPAEYADCTNFAGQGAAVQLTGGTSESAPLTAGVAALVIQAYARSHGGAFPTPAVVKQIIVSTAEDINAPGNQQGAGLLDAYQAVRAASSYPGTTVHPTGTAILKRSTQLNAVGQPGSMQRLSETVVNDGAGTAKLRISSRTVGTYRSLGATTLTLADATGDVGLVSFTEPPGQARLSVSIGYRGAGSSSDIDAAVNISLFSPEGQLAETSDPQGTANYGDAQVAVPAPGRWTALVFGAPSTEGGTVGPVRIGARTAPWETLGKLSTSSLTLAPGASGSFTLTAATPKDPGDQSGSLVLADATGPSFAAVTTVPVTLRSLVPTPDPSTTFTGTLTGGNGRQFSTGQSAYYEVSIPAGTPVLNAQITTTNGANTFMAELVDPVTGQVASVASSDRGCPRQWDQVGAATRDPAPRPASGCRRLDPHRRFLQPGRRHVVVPALHRHTGPAVGPVSAPGLPASRTTTLIDGIGRTVDVKVTNQGTTPEAYFVDARLDRSVELSLVSSTGPSVTVPVSSATVPRYLVPSHTTSITATASASVPIFFDYSWAFGDPDLISSGSGDSDTASGTFTDPFVASGDWIITPFQDGPDGTDGVPPVSVLTSMSATTAAFDPTITSTTGDLWLASTDVSAPLDAVVVGPGKSVELPITITPSGPVGSTVRGTLYIDDLSPSDAAVTEDSEPGITDDASDVAAFGYAYTVGAPPKP